MLQRTEHSNGVVTYQSPLLRDLGVPHAFSTRIGGISGSPFDALNLGNPAEGPQDLLANIQENYRRLQEAIGAASALRAWVRQVHGSAVELLDAEPENEYAETIEAEVRDRYSGQLAADGMISVLPGVLLTIRVADCVPVLLAARCRRMAGAVHAGWRGVVAGIVPRALRVMHEMGAAPGEVVAAIGPAISAEQFEVGDEVAAEFSRAGLGDAVRPPSDAAGRPHIDLQQAIRVQLGRAGVKAIDGHELCTMRDAGEFYSHRRDKGTTGRMAGVIMCV